MINALCIKYKVTCKADVARLLENTPDIPDVMLRRAEHALIGAGRNTWRSAMERRNELQRAAKQRSEVEALARAWGIL